MQDDTMPNPGEPCGGTGNHPIGYSCDECDPRWDEPEVCPDCGTATMAIHADGSKTCGHCYMKRAYDLGVLKGRRPPEYR